MCIMIQSITILLTILCSTQMYNSILNTSSNKSVANWMWKGGSNPDHDDILSQVNVPKVRLKVPSSLQFTATIIFLHGLGDPPRHKFDEAFEKIRQPYMKILCPEAPLIPITISAGYKYRAWFDKKNDHPHRCEDKEGIDRSRDLVHDLISAEIKSGIPADRIIVGGFDQGGAIAIHAALTFPQKVAGIIALSSWMPLIREYTQEVVVPVHKNLSLLQCHGSRDQIVRYNFGGLCTDLLRTYNVIAHCKLYPDMTHEITNEEMNDVKVFLEKHLKPIKPKSPTVDLHV